MGGLTRVTRTSPEKFGPYSRELSPDGVSEPSPAWPVILGLAGSGKANMPATHPEDFFSDYRSWGWIMHTVFSDYLPSGAECAHLSERPPSRSREPGTVKTSSPKWLESWSIHRPSTLPGRR